MEKGLVEYPVCAGSLWNNDQSYRKFSAIVVYVAHNGKAMEKGWRLRTYSFDLSPPEVNQ